MRELVAPGKNLSSNDSMMLWRDILVFRQYIKNKGHKYGINFYELCTYDGLVLTAEAYGGQGFNDENNLGQTVATVLKLMIPFLNKGHHVFTDNYYNSVSLSEYLSNHGTYTKGTLRKDRKLNPKWKDKGEVFTISNAHNPETANVSNRRGKGKMKLNIE